MMKALGAEVVLIDQMPDCVKGQVSGADLAHVEEKAREIEQERGAFRVDQFNLVATVHAHERAAVEMWEQSSGKIDVFVDFIGSGSTFRDAPQDSGNSKATSAATRSSLAPQPFMPETPSLTALTKYREAIA